MNIRKIAVFNSDYLFRGNNLIPDAITTNRITSNLQFSKGLRIQSVNATHYYL